MDNEHTEQRVRPRSLYQLQARLELPRAAIEATLSLLQKAGPRESGVFWYGLRDEQGNGTVSYVAAPQQQMTRFNYAVSTLALTELTRRLKPGWKPLAQIHSHPGHDVEHSAYDDRMASSKRALSIVFPYYGRRSRTFPSGIGIHEWQSDGWHLLTEPQAKQRVELSGAAVVVEDFRQ